MDCGEDEDGGDDGGGLRECKREGPDGLDGFDEVIRVHEGHEVHENVNVDETVWVNETVTVIEGGGLVEDW